MTLAAVASNSDGSSKEWLFGFEHLADPRTQGWLLVPSIKPVLAWLTLYLITVFQLPKLVIRFKPMKLQKCLIIYNGLMAVLNLHIFKEVLLTSYRLNYNYWCQPFQVVHSPDELKLASAMWWFYVSKLFELSDSVFFILRHKWSQLTPLHVYHHSTVFPLWWAAMKFAPTGASFFPALVNSFIHIIMYSYYGLSACGPRVQKYLWWKKYLTGIQLIQFSFGVVWSIQYMINECFVERWMPPVAILYMTSYLVLFSRFYTGKYRSNKNIKTS